MGAKIRHIAIASENPDIAIKFYKDALGLKEVSKVTSAGADGYYLTDGHITLAILKFKGGDGAEGPLGYTGLHHIGFHVDDLEGTAREMEKAGAKNAVKGPPKGPSQSNPSETASLKTKFFGPDGVEVEVRDHGWLTLTTA